MDLFTDEKEVFEERWWFSMKVKKRELLDCSPKLPNNVADPQKDQQVEYTTLLSIDGVLKINQFKEVNYDNVFY